MSGSTLIIGLLVAAVVGWPSALSWRLLALRAAPRTRRRLATPVADVALVLDLVAAALSAGLPAGRALAVVGAAVLAAERSGADPSGGAGSAPPAGWPSADPVSQAPVSIGEALSAAGAALSLGAPLELAWPRDLPDDVSAVARALEAHLRICEAGGVPATPVLRAGARDWRRRVRRQREADAARLGVRLVLPLGLCALPAFLVLAVVPVLSQLLGNLLR